MIRRVIARRAWLRIAPPAWDALIVELGRRTAGRREAGAFLLAPRHGQVNTVIDVAYYDDLDPHCLNGAVSFGFEGFGRLWDLCDAKDLRVIGDVHTHGGPDVSQSSIDRANPMVARIGHTALIVPHLATQFVSVRETGVYRYQGDAGWDARKGRRAAKALYVGRWA